jgi:hypothetical protein
MGELARAMMRTGYQRSLMETPMPSSATARTAILIAMLAGVSLMAAGCTALGFGGAMIESYRRTTKRTVEAEYTGLEGKRWAVIVVADRIIQADFPQIVPYITSRVTGMVSSQEAQNSVAAAGFIPADRLLPYLYQHPRWSAMPRSELAKDLGVERLIIIELLEFRLNEPGNQYVWAGQATGTVGVIEADGRIPDEFAFERPVRVQFPDKDGYGPTEIPRDGVSTELARRFVDRSAWLFFRHEEPYYPDY